MGLLWVVGSNAVATTAGRPQPQPALPCCCGSFPAAGLYAHIFHVKALRHHAHELAACSYQAQEECEPLQNFHQGKQTQ